jgi:hypothetical protein
MRRIITFILALSIGFVILEKMSFPLYAQRPLKDLRVGNIFYYFYAEGSLSTGYFFEKVIGDTVILGRSYAKVYSDPWRVTATLKDRLPRNNAVPIDTIRYERATDSAIYEWVPKDNREYTRLRSIPLYKEGDTTYFKSPLINCTNGCRIGLAPRLTGFDSEGNPLSWEFLVVDSPSPFVYSYANRGSGITSISNNQTGQIRREFNRTGVKFDNQIIPANGTIDLIQQLDTILQTSRITVGVREQEAAHSLSLAPNPVSDEAEVRFSLVSSKRVRLALVDNLGRVLLSIADEQLPSGEHRFPVHTETLANGVYWVRLWADASVQTVPLVVRK